MTTSEHLKRATKDVAALAEEHADVGTVLARYGVEMPPLTDYAYGRAAWGMKRILRDVPPLAVLGALFCHGVIVGLALAEEMDGPAETTVEAPQTDSGGS